MRKAIFELYKRLESNHSDKITYFEGSDRKEKTFKEFINDVNIVVKKINHLNSVEPVHNIAIIGFTSYQWMVIDHACIKGGFKSVAIPETFLEKEIIDIIKNVDVNLILADISLKENLINIDCRKYYFNSYDKDQNFNDIPILDAIEEDLNKILEEYSIVFSSGTSEKLKYINLKFHDIENENENGGIKDRMSSILGYIKYRKHFLFKKDNKIIIYLPFSHPMQRGFVFECLFRNINIVLSDPLLCFKHIITEKPNIMVSVPFVYEVMAKRIKAKIEKFDNLKRTIFRVYNWLKINNLPNYNYVKKLFSRILFQDIKKIYGGRADMFITGSAPINPEVIKVFYSVGVKLLEAYGQSELSAVIMNTNENFRIGSVGKPSVDTRIANDSEILIKYDEKYDAHNTNVLKVDGEGYIHTGDYGYLDKDGYLYIKGRKDDVLVLENGKKIHPKNIEDKFKKFGFIDQVVALTFNDVDINVILYISDGFRSKEEAIEEVKNAVTKVNKQVPEYEKIKLFHITSDPFTVDNGLLTPTFKFKRKAIQKEFVSKDFIRV